MAVHYLLDGYNVIKRTAVLADPPLQRGRERLLALLDRQRPHGSRRNPVTIVFDGQVGVSSPAPATTARVIFTKTESADEKIKRIVQASPHRKNIVVVTDDRQIRYHVKALGAKVMGVDEFLKPKGMSSLKPKGAAGLKEKRIPKTWEQTINDEFKKIWLKKKTS